MTYEQLIPFCKSVGIEGIEVVKIDLIDESLKKLKSIKNLCDKNGITISSLDPPPGDFARYSPEARQDDINVVSNWIEYAHILGVKQVRPLPGHIKGDIPYEKQLEWIVKGYKQVAKKAEVYGIDILHENHDSICFKADEIIDLIKRVDSPYFHVVVDPFNWCFNQKILLPVVTEKMYEDMTKIMPYVRNVHMKFAEFDRNGQEAYMDIKRVLKIMKNANYDGYWTLEYFPLFRQAKLGKDFNAIEDVTQAVELMKQYATEV